MKNKWIIASIALTLGANVWAQMTEERALKLAAAAQNPLASLISLPFQNNTTFGGTGGDYNNVLNIQPVWPFTLNEDWNLITRTIVPIVSAPVNGKQQRGIGDTVFTGWFSRIRILTSFSMAKRSCAEIDEKWVKSNRNRVAVTREPDCLT